MDSQDQPIDRLLFEAPQYLTPEDWQLKRAAIETYINTLIEHDFSRLVALLYRIDISEKKLRTLLANTSEINSASIITDLIIERQLQKMASRQKQQPPTDIPDEEQW